MGVFHNLNEIGKMEELEMLIEKRIGEVGDDELMSLWLKRCEIKLEKSKELEKRLSEKDPVIIGGIIGAFIGSLLK